MKDIIVKPTWNYFMFMMSAGELLDMKAVYTKVNYVLKHLAGYSTPRLDDMPHVIGVCGKQGENYNARVLSHEFLHLLLFDYISHEAKEKFDCICAAPLNMDGLGGVVFSENCHKRFMDRRGEIND